MRIKHLQQSTSHERTWTQRQAILRPDVPLY